MTTTLAPSLGSSRPHTWGERAGLAWRVDRDAELTLDDVLSPHEQEELLRHVDQREAAARAEWDQIAASLALSEPADEPPIGEEECSADQILQELYRRNDALRSGTRTLTAPVPRVEPGHEPAPGAPAPLDTAPVPRVVAERVDDHGVAGDAAAAGGDSGNGLPAAVTSALSAAEQLATLTATVDLLAGIDGNAEAASDANRIDLISACERLKGSLAAAQARLAVTFAASQSQSAADNGASTRAAERGITPQLALARRCSPTTADHHLAQARALTTLLPNTLDALTRGLIGPAHAAAVHAAATGLTPRHTHELDALLADRLPILSVKQLRAAADQIAAELDPHAVITKHERAVRSRRVWTRPAPDGMAYLTILGALPRIISAFAALRQHATAVVAGHVENEPIDGRTFTEVLADTALNRLSGLAQGEYAPVAVTLVMTPENLFGKNLNDVTSLFTPSGQDSAHAPSNPASTNRAHAPDRQTSSAAGMDAATDKPADKSAGSAAPGLHAAHSATGDTLSDDPGTRATTFDFGAHEPTADGGCPDGHDGGGHDDHDLDDRDDSGGHDGGGHDGHNGAGHERDNAGRWFAGRAAESGNSGTAGEAASGGGPPEPARAHPGQTESAAAPGHRPAHDSSAVAGDRQDPEGQSEPQAQHDRPGLEPRHPPIGHPVPGAPGQPPSHSHRLDQEQEQVPASQPGPGHSPGEGSRCAGAATPVRVLGHAARDYTLDPTPSAASAAASQDEGKPSEPDPIPGEHPATVTLRRAFTSPDGRDLVALESTARLFPPGLRALLLLRDDRCRMPDCDAEIRHADHITPAATDGPTSYTNGQGLSARCNYTKDLPGFATRKLTRDEVAAYAAGPDTDRNTQIARAAGPHTHITRVTTPTGHTYLSAAPPALGYRRRGRR